jgi:drug/metabolite transporter (DMT)-like permease
LELRKVGLILLIIFGVSLFSTVAIAVKLSSAPGAIIATYRFFLAALFFLVLVFLNKTAVKEIVKITKKQWLMVTLSGFFIAAHLILWFESLRFTSVSSASVLVNLQPLFAFIGGYWLYGEKLKKVAISGGIVAVLGSCIIGWGDIIIGGNALFGDILALLGAVVITAYFLVGQYLRKEFSVVSYSFLSYSMAGLFSLVYSIFGGYSLTGYSKQNWLTFLYLALVMILGYSIFNYLIKWFTTSTISMSIIIEPVGTCLLAYFILHEGITRQQIWGALIILIGILLFTAFNKTKVIVGQEQSL